ncbi:hypothetical protein GEMRC1_011048 [Eukaryota sp. GEM-RC1]
MPAKISHSLPLQKEDSPPAKKKKRNRSKNKKQVDAAATAATTTAPPPPKPKPKESTIAVLTSKTDKICRFFEVGMCRKGSACPFRHEGDGKPLPEPCRFFMSGSCNRGDRCPYVHDAKLAPCFKLFLDGYCDEHDSCRFSHDPNFWELYEKRRVLREEMKWSARVDDAAKGGKLRQ